MKSGSRNFITGLVVLLALVAFLWMLITFTGRATAAFASKGIPIVITVDRADGVSDGTPVAFRGVQVGKVSNLRLTEDNLHVVIDAEVGTKPGIPSNVHAVIRVQSMLSTTPTIMLELTGEPQGALEAHQQLQGRYVGSQILPPELTDFITDFRRQKLIEHTDEAIVALQVQIKNAGDMMKSVQSLVGDEKLQADIKQAVSNFQSLTHNANETVSTMRTTVQSTGEHVDELSRHILDDVDKLGKALDQFQELAVKINNGNGTAGRLLNDPRLYEQLADTAKELNAVAASIHRLIDQWEQEGLHVKLK
ncbi:MAG TPA: MlaD family protein [Humisphaera sp.]|jgi:phospholipid/cholesterol/gamma-HCH transport system substrate-binding protein|nr:MlaD family protein [Humisphaera sp.]